MERKLDVDFDRCLDDEIKKINSLIKPMNNFLTDHPDDLSVKANVNSLMDIMQQLKSSMNPEYKFKEIFQRIITNSYPPAGSFRDDSVGTAYQKFRQYNCSDEPEEVIDFEKILELLTERVEPYHNNSRSIPIIIDCDGLIDSLIESQLECMKNKKS